jgi:hypothetical protein
VFALNVPHCGAAFLLVGHKAVVGPQPLGELVRHPPGKTELQQGLASVELGKHAMGHPPRADHLPVPRKAQVAQPRGPLLPTGLKHRAGLPQIMEPCQKSHKAQGFLVIQAPVGSVKLARTLRLPSKDLPGHRGGVQHVGQKRVPGRSRLSPKADQRLF